MKQVGGTSNEELLLANPRSKPHPTGPPMDATCFTARTTARTNSISGAYAVAGDRKPFPLVQTRFSERLAQFSPDGQWIAYESDESGRSEIYLQPFTTAGPNAAARVLVSTAGGAQARWRHDGKALFYVALDDRIMETPIQFAAGKGSAAAGTPVPLFASVIPGGALQPFPRHQYRGHA